ncbi:MAG: hypothetical protein ACHQ4H_02970 [Ktedonobacterales bacterium]
MTALQADMQKLEAEIVTAGADAHVQQVAVQVAELSAKGDAAYQLLKAGMAVLLDSTDAEIRSLEAIALSVSGDAKAMLNCAHRTPEVRSGGSSRPGSCAKRSRRLNRQDGDALH